MEVCRLDSQEADALWRRQVEFADRGPNDSPDGSRLVLKIAVPPGATTAMISAVLDVDSNCSIQAHAGNGIICAHFGQFRLVDVTSALVGRLRPAAIKHGGSLIVVSTSLEGLTPHIVWGGRTEATILMERIKHKFDPHGILNPGRFVI
jgi:FAD/FMN-containing dehydrogenase